MNKDEAVKMWLELNKIHKKLILHGYSTIGDPVQAPIKRAERAIKAAMDILKPQVEKK